MDRFVTFRELTDFRDEFKDWALAQFVTKGEFSELNQEVKELNLEVKGLKLEVRGLKGEFSEFRLEFSGLKQEVRGLKEEFSEFKNESMSRFDYLFGAVEDIKQEQLFTNHALSRIESKLGI